MYYYKKHKKYITIKQFKSGECEGIIKVSPIYNTQVDRSRKTDPSISSARVSIRRAHKKLFDVLRCSDWQFFITLTFGFEGRLADELCRSSFSKWSKEMRRKFPSMYYVAVPEYHKKGGLHYHIAVGGVSASELRLVYSGRVQHRVKGRCQSWLEEDFFANGFAVDEETGEGAKIYNVMAWKSGNSTATEVRCTDAVARYVGKYLTKCDIDPRFYNKRRYHTSHNIALPLVIKFDEIFGDQSVLPADDDLMRDYNMDKTYCKESFGISKFATPTKEDIIRMRLNGELPSDTL